MSGGSFDYLCLKEDEDLIWKADEIREMARAIREYPGGETAARDTERVAAKIDARTALVDEDLRKVWHDVEWHHSADVGAETVHKTLASYNTRSLPAAVETTEIERLTQAAALARQAISALVNHCACAHSDLPLCALVDKAMAALQEPLR